MNEQNHILLSVRDLQVRFGNPARPVRAVDGVSFDIRRGETFALLGESGCGKSITALSILQLVPSPAGHIVNGQIHFQGEDLLLKSESQMRHVRGNRISMIFQEPMTSLNPVMTIGRQIGEVLVLHEGLAGRALQDRIVGLLDAVGIPSASRRLNDYPHQLSGGMKQRVMIAMALAASPDLLIADEPTTALDVTIQAQVMDLLAKIQQEQGMSILLITHDLGVVADNVDHVAVMYAGQVVEQARRAELFSNPLHPYTRKLFAAVPGSHKRGQKLDTIKGSVPPLDRKFTGCRFAERCDDAWMRCYEQVPRWLFLENDDPHGIRCHQYDASIDDRPSLTRHAPAEAKSSVERASQSAGEPLLELQDLKVHFPIHKGLFKRTVGHVYAVDGVNLQIRKGQTLALVGESGCGKTTVGKALLQLIRPTAGHVRFMGKELTELSGESLRRLRARMQLIFQDPFASMNPRMLVRRILEEGMRAQGVVRSEQERAERVTALLNFVGLPESAAERYPHEFSGGQRQRICIARSLAVEPALLVCDEPTSALDVSVQAQTLNLFKSLQEQIGLSYLFITHNISVVEYLAHQVAVMYLGRIIEQGPVAMVIDTPSHPYTQALLAAVPRIEGKRGEAKIVLEGEIPSAINPPTGCHYHPRCPLAEPRCHTEYPSVRRTADGKQVACHLVPGVD